MRSVLLSVGLLLLAACGREAVVCNDLTARHLYGPVYEVVPEGAGERLRFDSLGRLTDAVRTDASGAGYGVYSHYSYAALDEETVECTDTQYLYGSPYASWHSTIARTDRGYRIEYFDLDEESGRRTPLRVGAEYRFSGGRLTAVLGRDGSVTSFSYRNGERLPQTETSARNGETFLTLRYRYDEVDSLGNWLRRTVHASGCAPRTERRRIVYRHP